MNFSVLKNGYTEVYVGLLWVPHRNLIKKLFSSLDFIDRTFIKISELMNIEYSTSHTINMVISPNTTVPLCHNTHE